MMGGKVLLLGEETFWSRGCYPRNAGREGFFLLGRRIFQEHSLAPERFFSISLGRNTSHSLLVTKEHPFQVGEIVAIG